MTSTLRTILLHGPILIEKTLLIIRQLLEESTEVRNKNFRLYRLLTMRDNSRENIAIVMRLGTTMRR